VATTTKRVLVRAREMREALGGITRQTESAWRHAGCPVVLVPGRGRQRAIPLYDLAEVEAWLRKWSETHGGTRAHRDTPPQAPATPSMAPPAAARRGRPRRLPV